MWYTKTLNLLDIALWEEVFEIFEGSINFTDPTGLVAYGANGPYNTEEEKANYKSEWRTSVPTQTDDTTTPTNPVIPLPKFLLNFITSFGITKDPDSAFYRFCAERIRENIHIVITRSPLDNGHNGQYFKSTIAIMFGDTTIFSAPVQSTMDENNPDRLGSNDFTLPAGLYEGRFMDDLYSQTYLHPILIFSTDFYIHPDTITNQDMVQARIDEDNPNPTGPFFTPHSKGCQIMKTSDFNTMINFFNTVGFGYGDKINVEIKNPDNWAYK